MRLLLVEDHLELSRWIARALAQSHFTVERALNGADADALLAVQQFDLVILDLTLPRVDGLEVLRRLRARGSRTPVLVVTARGEVSDRVRGLNLGADDYLAKPFDPRELVLRINNILKRNTIADAPKIEQIMFGPYTFSLSRRELKKASELIRLTDREQEIMLLFASRAGDTIPRHELIGNDTEVGERTIDVQINRLRRKIEDDPANPVWLQTVRGIGYRLSMD